MYLFISSHWEVNTYKIWIYINFVTVGTENPVGRRKPCWKRLRECLYLTKVHLPKIVLDVRIQKLLGLLELKLSLVWGSKNRLVKGLLHQRKFIIFIKCNQTLIKFPKNFSYVCPNFCLLRSDFVSNWG